MADSRRYKNRFWPADSPISVKFCTWKQNSMAIEVT